MATVLVSWPDMAKVVTLDNAPVTLAEPLKFWPQMVRVVCNTVAEPALPANALNASTTLVPSQ